MSAFRRAVVRGVRFLGGPITVRLKLDTTYGRWYVVSALRRTVVRGVRLFRRTDHGPAKAGHGHHVRIGRRTDRTLQYVVSAFRRTSHGPAKAGHYVQQTVTVRLKPDTTYSKLSRSG